MNSYEYLINFSSFKINIKSKSKEIIIIRYANIKKKTNIYLVNKFYAVVFIKKVKKKCNF